ncbi:unnamed protein product [Urochloa decumbens]|uniref:Late embryogenesis abundant protein LEA-2 subgroup domain-containing protein n=1 Tax=Urochloa decumbens TaxID=240449 RepID=A0ABC9AAR5_9POAL
MNHPQEGVVYGYSELTYVSTAGPPPYPPPPPPLPPPRRRLSPFRILIRAFIGALSLLIWLIYRPRTIRVAVATAILAGFDLNTTASSFSFTPVLSYNLTAVVEIWNPNRRVSVYYDRLQASGIYQGERFGWAPLPVSFQGTRRADAAPAVLVGRSPAYVNADAFGEDSRVGVFPVELCVEGVVTREVQVRRADHHQGEHADGKCLLALKLMVASGWVDCTVIDF